jgi:hypothetical protein
MQNLAVAVFALLLGVGVYSDANAAMPSPGLRAAVDALSRGDVAREKSRRGANGYVLLVQGYGGGGGRDDDDDRPVYRPQPQYHPQQHYQRNDNGNGNGAAAGAAIVNGIIGAIQEQQRRKRIEEDNNRYQREQNYRNNKRREDDLRNQKRREDARRDEIKRREEAIKRKENAKKEDAAKARLKEKIQELEDEKNAAEKEKKLPGYSPVPSDERKPYVDQRPVPDPQPYHDIIGPNVINIVPPPDNCPDNFSELKVGPTTLYPRRTDYPADSSLCAGRTSKGCYLRLQNAPSSCGRGAPVCVEYCIDPLPPPVVTPKPIIVTPNPVVEDRKPVVKIYPDVLPPTYEPPKPIVKIYPSKKTDTAGDYTEPKPKPKPAVKTDIAQETYEPKPKPKPAVKTDIAQETYEPKRKPKPAVKTDIAQETYEPKPKPKPAVKTDIAQETYEPKPKPKPAVKTDIAQETYEPKPKPKPAVKTDIAQETYEPKPKPKPAVKTDIAHETTEAKHQTPAVKTDIAHEETEKKSSEPVKTDKAGDYKETKNTHEQGLQTADARPSDKHKDTSSTSAKKTDTTKSKDPANNGDPKNESKADIDEARPSDNLPINPVECPNLNLGSCGERFKKQREDGEKKFNEEVKIAREEKKKRDDAIAQEKKKAAEDKDAIENPGKPDGKGCTANGDIPIKALLADPNYGKLLSGEGDVAPISTKGQFEKLHLRAITSAGLKLVPEVGAVLSGAVDFLWTDPKADRLFDEMLNYVNRLVPDSITKERLGQQSFDIDGLRKLLKGYKHEDNFFQKGLDLKILTNRLAELEPAYLDNPDTPPEKMLPLVVAYGKLRLAALQEQLLHQKEYFPNNASTSLVSDYNDAVDALTAKAKEIKDAIIANRLKRIHLDDNMHDAKDEAPISEGGMFMGWPQAHYFSAHDDFCEWNPAEHKEDRGPAQAEFENRKAATKRAYERDLDLLLAPITKWPSLTPVARTADAKGRPVDDGANLDEAMPSAYIDRNGLATLGDADGTELGSFAGEALKSLPMALAKPCTRHFRNESNDTWEVRGSEGSGICEKPGSCVVKPHHTIEIYYPTLEQSFRMTITGGGQSAYHDDFEVKQGNLITTGNCAYIKHDGRTGLARLNQPADGDITALNGDAKHRLARRMESIRRIVQPLRRRECLQHPFKCRYAHDD